jgi:hypothetical protein
MAPDVEAERSQMRHQDSWKAAVVSQKRAILRTSGDVVSAMFAPHTGPRLSYTPTVGFSPALCPWRVKRSSKQVVNSCLGYREALVFSRHVEFLYLSIVNRVLE